MLLGFWLESGFAPLPQSCAADAIEESRMIFRTGEGRERSI